MRGTLPSLAAHAPYIINIVCFILIYPPAASLCHIAVIIICNIFHEDREEEEEKR